MSKKATGVAATKPKAATEKKESKGQSVEKVIGGNIFRGEIVSKSADGFVSVLWEGATEPVAVHENDL